MIPAEQLTEVRRHHDLVAYIQSCGVQLKRAGKGYLGLCPFHRDGRTLSLSVDPQKQLWCCLGACSPAGKKKTGGDLFAFDMLLNHRSLRESFVHFGGELIDELPAPRKKSLPAQPAAAPTRGDYARRCVRQLAAAPSAQAYIRSRGVTSAAIVERLGVGYSDGTLLTHAPEGSNMRRQLAELGIVTSIGRDYELLTHCIVFPLRDLERNIVGFYGRRIEGDGHCFTAGERRGLINAECAAAADHLIFTESPIDALSFLEAGIMNVVPLYGIHGWTADHDALLARHRIRKVTLCLDSDAAGQNAAQALVHKLEAQRIEVRNVVLPAKDANELLVREGRERFATIWRELTSAQQSATKKEAPSPAVMSAPPADGLHRFTFAARTWSVSGLTATGLTRMRVVLRIEHQGRVHRDHIDLYSDRARRSLIERLVEVLGANDVELASEIDSVIDALERERLAMCAQATSAETTSTEPKMTQAEREEAMAMGRSPRLLEILREDVLAIGCVGEWESMLPAYLAALTRKLDAPLSVLFCARSGAGKSNMQEKISSLVPAEELVSYTRITGQALFYNDENALVHKLLAIDEDDGVAAAAYAVRSLQSAGYLSSLYTRTDPQTGKQKSEECRVNGPASIFSTTPHPETLDYETRNRFLVLTADESKEQTARILERQRWNATLEGLVARHRGESVMRRHHNFQRLLASIEVVVPADLATRFPKGRLIFRREHPKYLTLIRAMAFLHQHQRERRFVDVDGKRIEYIEATLADVEAIHDLAMALLRRNLDELSAPARSLVRAIRDLVIQKQETRFDRKELQRSAGLSVWHVKNYLAELVEQEYIAPIVGKKGQRYLYELLWDGVEEDLGA